MISNYQIAIDSSRATLAGVMHNSTQNTSTSGPSAGLLFDSAPSLPVSAEKNDACGIERCPICGNFLCGVYYRVNGKVACALCAIQARARSSNEKRTPFGRFLGFDRFLSILASRSRNLGRLDGPYKA
jgi:hypothetical protein